MTDAEFALKIVQFDVGQADAAAVLTPDGYCCLIDMGRTNAHGKSIAAFLGDVALNGIQDFEAIDLLFVSHYDMDHIGGALKLGDRLAVRAAYDQGPTPYRSITTRTGRVSGYGKYVELVGDPDGDGVQDEDEATFVRHQAEYGDAFALGDAEVLVLSVRGDTRGEAYDIDRNPSHAETVRFDENPGSIVLLVRLGEFEFLTTGDATCADWVGKPDTENSIIHAGAIPNGPDIDVLKVSHHGSDTSSGELFISQTKPKIAIISSHVHSPHYVPKKTSMMMLDRFGALTLVTGAATDDQGNFVESSSEVDNNYQPTPERIFDQQGTITIWVSSDGSKYTVRTAPARGEPREWTFSSFDEDHLPPGMPDRGFTTAPSLPEAISPALAPSVNERSLTANHPSFVGDVTECRKVRSALPGFRIRRVEVRQHGPLYRWFGKCVRQRCQPRR